MIYRITPTFARSNRALDSQAGLPITEIPAVVPKEDTKREREIAVSFAHAAAIQAFLATDAPFATILEDDAILSPNRDWLEFTQFDLFIPFANNRDQLPEDSTIRIGLLPRFGAFAYRCSRLFAERYLPRLLAQEITDNANHDAAQGLRFASFAGNLVNHDNHSPSQVCEARRRHYLYLQCKAVRQNQ